jgi:DNA-binding CsgD family transcriptional regulator
MSAQGLSITVPTAELGAEEKCRMALSAIARGDWPDAGGRAEGCLVLADPLTQPEVRAHGEAAAGIVAAVRGDAAAALSHFERCEHAAISLGMTNLLDVVQLGRGVEAISAGRYDEALARLRQVVDSPSQQSTWVRLVAVGFLAEAGLFRGGDHAVGAVRAAVARLAAAPELRGGTAFAWAMASPEVPVAVRFDRALAECPVDRAFDRARINLARGVLLRRERKVVESRLPLQEALVAFERLGALAWADRARRELRATGARRTRREIGAVEALTEQELQIVRLAAAGLTNREIGQRLFLSHRTIGSHLYRAFPKLGIAARSQLRDVLRDLTDLDLAPRRVAH